MVYGMGFATLFNHLILLDQDVYTKLLEGKIISIHHIILIKKYFNWLYASPLNSADILILVGYMLIRLNIPFLRVNFMVSVGDLQILKWVATLALYKAIEIGGISPYIVLTLYQFRYS